MVPKRLSLAEAAELRAYNASQTIPYEMFTLSASLTIAVLKILFAFLTILYLWVQLEVEGGEEYPFELGSPQLYCILIYIVVALITSINTILLVNSRMYESFLDNFTALNNYNWSNTFGALVLLGVQIIYMFDRPDTYAGNVYGDILIVIIGGDLIACGLMYILEWRVNHKREQIADGVVGAVLISSEKDSARAVRVGSC